MGPSYQTAKQAEDGKQRRIDTYEFCSKISRVKGWDASSIEVRNEGADSRGGKEEKASGFV